MTTVPADITGRPTPYPSVRWLGTAMMRPRRVSGRSERSRRLHRTWYARPIPTPDTRDSQMEMTQFQPTTIKSISTHHPSFPLSIRSTHRRRQAPQGKACASSHTRYARVRRTRRPRSPRRALRRNRLQRATASARWRGTHWSTSAQEHDTPSFAKWHNVLEGFGSDLLSASPPECKVIDEFFIKTTAGKPNGQDAVLAGLVPPPRRSRLASTPSTRR